MPHGPLHGIRVLEVSQIVAGPVCGMLLADLGADVVKLEGPEGDGARRLGMFMPNESKPFHALNRGKRSLVLNLRDPRAQQIAHAILPAYDVFIINARPGVSARLRLDYETLRGLRPDLIYMENTGYGARGPNAQRSGSDVVAQAYSGLMAGDEKINADGAPELITASAVADIASAIAGAMAVNAALFHRERTGEGQKVETSLLATGLAMQANYVARVPVVDALIRDRQVERMNAVRARGGSYRELQEARGGTMAQLGAAFRLYYGGYDVRDGAIILGALTPANREQIRTVLGITHDPTADPEFNALDATNDAKVAAARERVKAVMKTRTMAEWMEALDAVGAPAAPVHFPEEVLDDPQVAAMDYAIEVEHALTGPERHMGALVQMSATPTGSDKASPPRDADTDAILAAHGYDAATIAAWRAEGVIGVPGA